MVWIGPQHGRVELLFVTTIYAFDRMYHLIKDGVIFFHVIFCRDTGWITKVC